MTVPPAVPPALVTGLAPLHALGDRFSSPLPLVAYLAGACAAVVASIMIALRRDPHASQRHAQGAEIGRAHV